MEHAGSLEKAKSSHSFGVKNILLMPKDYVGVRVYDELALLVARLSDSNGSSAVRRLGAVQKTAGFDRTA
jgi:hypothetical protein